MNRRLILVAVAACALVTGAWYAFLWSPQSDQISDTKQQLATTEQQQKDLGVQLRGLEAAKKKLPEINLQLNSLRTSLPPAPQLDNAIATVQDAAKASGVEVTALTPTPLPASSRADSATHVGFTQTVANLNCAASRQSSSMFWRVASGFKSV